MKSGTQSDDIAELASSPGLLMLRDWIRERTGLLIGPEGLEPLARRVRKRLQRLGLSTTTDYHRYLRLHPDREQEAEQFFDLVANKETYFFREDYQLEGFRNELLPAIAARVLPRRVCMIWSMGCSTGEEAYSIGMVLIESGLFGRDSARVLGSDLSRRSLTVARRALYPENAFRSTSPERRARFFVRTSHGVRVVDEVREMCHFSQANLLELEAWSVIDEVDVVFCRNVLMYFAPEARRAVLAGIFRRLRPGGFLLLGHSESLLSERTTFEPVRLLRDVIVYRKPDSVGGPERCERTRAE